jgi:hypothetical protein
MIVEVFPKFYSGRDPGELINDVVGLADCVR